MAALQCEICGGKLIGKPGGVFECDSCGMEYSTEWAKAKVQEIKGTVKVEGGASVESLLKRGWMLLKDRDWRKADEYFDKVLDIEPENGEAYAGKFCAEKKFAELKYIAQDTDHCHVFKYNEKYKKAILFGNDALKAELEGYLAAANKKKDAVPHLAARREELKKVSGLIAAGAFHTVGLKADGTVVAVGSNKCGQCDVNGWSNIVAVAAGNFHTVGVKADGTVVAVGDNRFGECDVNGWSDIVAIAAGGLGLFYTVGLKSDGTVVSTNEDIQKEVNSWRNIVAVAINSGHTIGLRKSGRVVGTGIIQSTVSAWRDIVAIAGGLGIIGLRADGTVVTEYSVNKGKYSDWQDIVAFAGGSNEVGLRADGTVVAAGKNEHGQCNVDGWTDIVAIAANSRYTVGLRSDGTVMAVGDNGSGQCDVGSWKLFKSIDTLEQERKGFEAERRRQEEEKERQAKIAALEAEKASIQAELPNIKGLFSSGKRRELEARLAQIEKELNAL